MTGAAPAALPEQFLSDGGLARYEIPTWRDELGIVAGVTAARDGFDLRLDPDQPDDAVTARWAGLPRRLGAGLSGVVVSRQVHGARLGLHREPHDGVRVLDGLDGHVSDAGGLLLAVTVADCVPVYLADPAGGALGLLHAGWRGVAAGVLEAGIERLCELSGTAPCQIVMHCGVSICGACYKVGPEVFEAVVGEPREAPTGLDLREVLRLRALALGLERVTLSPWCSAHDASEFYSHRRSGGRDGRMAAYLGRPMP